jgi:hypothetical protein
MVDRQSSNHVKVASPRTIYYLLVVSFGRLGAPALTLLGDLACLLPRVWVWGFWFGFALRRVALLCGVFVQLHLALFPAGGPFLSSLYVTLLPVHRAFLLPGCGRCPYRFCDFQMLSCASVVHRPSSVQLPCVCARSASCRLIWF